MVTVTDPLTESPPALSHHRITIHNRSNSPQSYFLFCSKPLINEDDILPSEICTSVCQRSSRIFRGSQHMFEFSRTFYAIAGTAHSPIEPGVSLVITAALPVVLGSQQMGVQGSFFTLVAEPGRQPELVKGQPEGMDLPGGTAGFWVVTKPDFAVPSEQNVFIGVGIKFTDNNDEPTAVSVLTAQPNQLYNITPTKRFFVSHLSGGFAANEILDERLFRNTAFSLEIDMALRGNNVRVEHSDMGVLSVLLKSSSL